MKVFIVGPITTVRVRYKDLPCVLVLTEPLGCYWPFITFDGISYRDMLNDRCSGPIVFCPDNHLHSGVIWVDLDNNIRYGTKDSYDTYRRIL